MGDEDASVRIEVPARPEVVSDVRRAFAKLPLSERGLDTARLLVTELVTNSIRHAGLREDEPIRIRATVNGGVLRVDVLDRDRRHVRRTVAGAIRPPPGSESGWGLYLVDRLTTRWGWGPEGYWFELRDDREST